MTGSVTTSERLTATEAARALAAGALTSERLVTACLERIGEREETVGAWAHLDADRALVEARQRDREARRGALHGIPVGVKDIIDTHDSPTEYGSPIYKGHRPAADAACVALARRAGAVILGKTVSTEFAFFPPGKTANPHNPEHTPGGSSSGSAAAVADFMVPLAFGSQTAGSVIRPASFCGVVGYKFSYGQASMVGIKPFSPSLDTLGVFTRRVGDVALVRAALVDAPDGLDAPVTPPRIGVCRTPVFDRAEPATVAALEWARDLFSAAGAAVSEVVLPTQFSGLIDAQQTVMAFEAARGLAFERDAHGDMLHPHLRDFLDRARGTGLDDYRRALAASRSCARDLEGILASVDVLLTPSATGEAPRGLQATGDPIFSRIWTLLQVPTVTLPGYRGPRGLPVGVQAVGRFGADDALLGVAAWMERVLCAATS
jgi:Asp-tRNA(Asn)/Glu-tRNA(Gln) amidotransferase A subunit family amidase